MTAAWRQGLVFSLLVHGLVLSGGLLWSLVRHPEPPDPEPIEARLVAPEPAEKPAPEPEKAPQPAEPEKQPAPEPAKPEPEPAKTEPEPKPKALAKTESEPDSEPEPAEPVTKKPAHPEPKKRIARPEPEKSEPKAPAPEPETAKAEEAEPEEPEPEKPEPILDDQLTDKIAKLAEGSDGAEGSLRQRRAVARFQEAVRSRVQANWLVPPGLEERADLSAVVRITLTAAGELATRPKVVQSNGPGYFNSSVVRAVEKAAPFPMPDGPTQYFQNLELHFSPDMVR